VKKILILSVLVLLASSCGGLPESISLVKGTGLFIWQLFNIPPFSATDKTVEYFAGKNAEGKDVMGQSVTLETVIERCERAKATWVVIKLGDSDSFWLREDSSIESWLKNQKLTFKQMVDKFHEKGIKVHGFQFIYGSDRYSMSTEAECGKNIIESGIDGFFIDAEFDVEASLNATQTMEKYFEGIKNSPSFSKILIGYTTFGQLSKHFRIPYQTFEKYCDVFIPQCYWVDRDPDCKFFSPQYEIQTFTEDLRQNQQAKGYKFTKSGSMESIIPAGSVESEVCRGTHAQAVDIVRFKDGFKETNPTGLCWWSLDWMNESDLDTLGMW